MKGLKFLVLLALIVSAVPAFAAVDAFLKINGINGEARGTHQGWIEVESWSWGPSNPASCSSKAATLTVREAAMQKMVLLTGEGKLLPAVSVDVKGQQHVLDNVMFTSAKASSNLTNPATTFTLNFTRCETHGGTANATMINARVRPEANAKILVGLTPRPEAFHFTSFQFQGRNGAIILQSNPGPNNFFQQAFQSQQTFPSITVRKAGKGQHEYFQVKLTEVLVSSYQVMGDGSVKIGLNFSKAEGSPNGFQEVN